MFFAFYFFKDSHFTGHFVLESQILTFSRFYRHGISVHLITTTFTKAQDYCSGYSCYDTGGQWSQPSCSPTPHTHRPYSLLTVLTGAHMLAPEHPSQRGRSTHARS